MKNTLNKAIFFTYIIFLVGCNKIDSQQPLDNILIDLREKYNIPAISVAIVSPENTIYTKAIGLKSLHSADSVQVEDAFHIGSNTKAITSLLCAILVEKDLIKWNTKIFDVFPEFLEKANPIYKDVTLKDLLSHKGGIKTFTQKDEALSLPKYSGSAVEQRIKFTQQLLEYPSEYVGTFDYSNGGYTIACAMIERATGSPWKSLIKKYIFEPFSLNANFGWPFENASNSVIGHYQQPSSSSLQPHLDTTYRVNTLIESAGDINMSVVDFGKYLQAYLKVMKSENTSLNISFDFLKESNAQYSMGWYKKGINNNTLYEHFGSAGTFHSYAGIVEDKEVAFTIFINAYSEETKDALVELKEIILEKIDKGIIKPADNNQ